MRSTKELSDKDYLYIFVHIPKTGGSTFRKHIEKNVPEDERWCLDYPKLRLGVKKLDKKKFLERVQKDADQLSSDRKKGIRVIYGHMVPNGVHKLFEKPPRYVIFLRNPEKRLLSLYNYFATRYHRDQVKGVTDKAYDYQFLVSGKLPKFEEWVENKYGQSGMAVETTLQHLKNLGYLRSIYSKNEYKKALDLFYYIAITKHLNDDLNYLYQILGFRKFFVNQNISRKFVTDFRIQKLSEQYIRRNMLFFKMAEEKRNKIINKLNTAIVAKKVEMQKKLLLPFTQIAYDFEGILTEFSARLRVKSSFYARIFDYLRGYKQSK